MEQHPARFSDGAIRSLPIGHVIWLDAYGTTDTWEYDGAVDWDKNMPIDTFGRYYVGENNTIIFMQTCQLGDGFKKMCIPNSCVKEIITLISIQQPGIPDDEGGM